MSISETRFIKPTFKENLVFVLKQCELIDKSDGEKEALDYIIKQSD